MLTRRTFLRRLSMSAAAAAIESTPANVKKDLGRWLPTVNAPDAPTAGKSQD